MILINSPFPKKLWKYMRLPTGTNIEAAIKVEAEDIIRVLAVMLKTSLSPVRMSLMAVRKLSINRSKDLLTSLFDYHCGSSPLIGMKKGIPYLLKP